MILGETLQERNNITLVQKLGNMFADMIINEIQFIDLKSFI